jgi:hypothetical protein
MPIEIADGTQQYSFAARPAEEIKGIKIQVLYKIEGQSDWVLEDWTNKPYVSFCRDAKAERLQELVIIYSNSGYQPTDWVRAEELPPVLEASDIGCWRYSGSASFKFTGQSIGWFEDEQQVPTVAFERLDVHPDIPYPFVRFGVVEGQWQRTYHIENSELGCIGNASDSAALTSANSSGGLAVLTGASSGPSLRAYVGTSTVGRTLSVSIVCPQGSFPSPLQTLPWFGLDQLTRYKENPYLVQVGGALKGSDDLPLGGGATYHFVWDLAPLREP